MRLVTWNIRAGGGKRTAGIADILVKEKADIVVLTEYRPAPGIALLEALGSLSYEVCAGRSVGSQNSVCVLSRYPLEPLDADPFPKNVHRWLPVHVAALDLSILAIHVPNQNEVWNKQEFWDCIEFFAKANESRRTLIVGDLNTALDEDCEGDPIRAAVHFQNLLDAGWVDAWRTCNRGLREFSWYSHRNNGFRLDHCLVSPPLACSVVAANMRHDVRTERLSDHSMLTVELSIEPS